MKNTYSPPETGLGTMTDIHHLIPFPTPPGFPQPDFAMWQL